MPKYFFVFSVISCFMYLKLYIFVLRASGLGLISSMRSDNRKDIQSVISDIQSDISKAITYLELKYHECLANKLLDPNTAPKPIGKY